MWVKLATAATAVTPVLAVRWQNPVVPAGAPPATPTRQPEAGSRKVQTKIRAAK